MAVSKNVTVIPARKHARKSKDEEKPKLRVAAYCRVSTDNEEQATSYDTQIEHYTAYIQGHPDWMLAGIFADDGISGTFRILNNFPFLYKLLLLCLNLHWHTYHLKYFFLSLCFSRGLQVQPYCAF